MRYLIAIFVCAAAIAQQVTLTPDKTGIVVEAVGTTNKNTFTRPQLQGYEANITNEVAQLSFRLTALNAQLKDVQMFLGLCNVLGVSNIPIPPTATNATVAITNAPAATVNTNTLPTTTNETPTISKGK